MLVRAYLPNFLTALFGGLFIAAGILTFGDSFIFDRLYIGVLIFALVVCRTNINVVSVVVIILIQLALEHLAWMFLSENYFIKCLLYSAAFWAAYSYRYDWVIKTIVPITILVSVSEVFWYVTDYPAPQIYWHIAIMISNLITRYLLFSRVSFVEDYFPGKGESINLDWIIYKLSALTIIVQALVVFEYLARHILGFSSILFIYYSYPYLIQGIGTIALWSTFNESYKQLLPRLLKA